MKTVLLYLIKRMDKFIGKRLKSFSYVILAFIFGSTLTLILIPIDKKCNIETTEQYEYKFMYRNPEVIILILSAPNNFERRSLLRNTWLKLEPEGFEDTLKVKHFFVIGNLSLSLSVTQHIKNEQSKYFDILSVPVIDSYKNLTNKIKYSFRILHKKSTEGLDFKYMLKCDDDSFVNLKQFLLCLKNIKNIIQSTEKNAIISTNYQNSGSSNREANLYWGYFSGNARIKNKGKWKETDWIASDRYVPYAVGGGYLLSKELVSYIAKNSQYLKSFNSEDVSVGFWLAPVNNIYRIHDIRFDTEWTSRGCKNSHLITHNILPKNMKQLFYNLITTGKMCSEEVTNRSYYIYNWDVLPSQCCNLPINKELS